VIVYRVSSSELEESEYLPTKADALKRAREFEDFEVTRVDINDRRPARELACLLLNGRAFARSQVVVAERDIPRFSRAPARIEYEADE
jgi:hypothetical protein